MINGARKYKVEFFPKVKFKPFMTEAGFSGAANTIMETITSSVSPEDSAKN